MTAKNRKLLAFFAAVVLIAVISGAIIYTYNANRVPDAPEILPDSGLYTRERKIVINKPSGAATTMYYTLDGSDPKTSSNVLVYTGPFIINADTTIKAYAKDERGLESEVVEKHYEIRIGG